ncbi:MAG: hypothetical protein WA369_01350, partial [Candidatus Acidiferrales bacterium]
MQYRKSKGAHMNDNIFMPAGKHRPAAIGLAILIAAGGAAGIPVQAPATADGAATQTTESGDFRCNMHALTPAERAHHLRLTEKLIASRKAIVEMPKGYEFQYAPSSVTLAELADWTVHEAKCCPFFDFHIDLERQGNLICLRLTGQEGIKPIIRSEFNVPAE